MARLVVILPPDADTPLGWAQVEGGGIVARGEGNGWPRLAELATPATLLVPAAAITLHRALLPDLAPRQAAAAARLMAAENALGAPDTLHVATGARDADGALDVAVVAAADMALWLGWADAHALDVQAMVPAALLLPRPEEGFVRARVGAEWIARDRSAAFALDPGFGALVIGEAPVVDLDDGALIAALAAAVEAPPLDLRQGLFARRQRRTFDVALLKRAAGLAGAALLLALLISVVRIGRLDADSARLDARALANARTAVPGAGDVAQAEAALAERAAALGVGGRGVASGAARVFAALEPVPAVTLSEYSLNADGSVRATIVAPGAAELSAASAALTAAGLGVVGAPAPGADGRPAVQLTVAPR